MAWGTNTTENCRPMRPFYHKCIQPQIPRFKEQQDDVTRNIHRSLRTRSVIVSKNSLYAYISCKWSSLSDHCNERLIYLDLYVSGEVIFVPLKSKVRVSANIKNVFIKLMKFVKTTSLHPEPLRSHQEDGSFLDSLAWNTFLPQLLRFPKVWRKS